MNFEEPQTWVVFRLTVHGKLLTNHAVCTQSEWESMERNRPGYHNLVQSGFRSENAAEISARGTSGDPIRRQSTAK